MGSFAHNLPPLIADTSRRSDRDPLRTPCAATILKTSSSGAGVDADSAGERSLAHRDEAECGRSCDTEDY